ncbi:MAG: cytidine deaminase [Chitinophagaceae bacterium]
MKKIHTIEYVQTLEGSLSAKEKILFQSAKEAYKNAYVPYSKFYVGAAAWLDNDTIVKGCNVENASFPVTLCAERNLLAHVQQYYHKVMILMIAITFYHKGNSLQTPISPCGMCRQALLEFEIKQNQPIKIVLGGMGEDRLIVHSVKDLLPFSFTGEYLV